VQRFDFKKFSVDQIAGKLKSIVKKEKMEADEGALRMIAYAAEGGLRDAESMLSQVLSHSPKKVTQEAVQDVLGIVSFTQTSEFAELLIKKDLKETLKYLNMFAQKGGNPEEFLKSAVNYLRKMLLIWVDKNLRVFVTPELTDDQFSIMMSQSQKLKRDELEEMLKTFIEAEDNAKKTSLPLLPTELALMRLFGDKSNA